MDSIIQIGVYPESPALIRGGVEASTYGLANALTQFNTVEKVTVLACPLPHTKASTTITGKLNVFQYHLPYGFLFSSILLFGQFYHQIKRAKPTIIHLHGAHPLVYVLLTFLSFSKYKAKIIYTLHGIVEIEQANRLKNRKTLKLYLQYYLYRILETMVLKRSPTIIVDTTYVFNHVPSRFRNKVLIIPQGVYLSDYKRCYNQEKNEANNILAIGSISRRKGHDLLIESFRHLLSITTLNPHLFIVGAAHEKEYHYQLLKLIRKYQLTQHITLIVDAPKSKILQLLSQCRIFALHTQEESQGIAIVEAMASGIPIVATNVGGVPDIVTSGQEGYLVQYGSIERFADRFNELLSNMALYQKMSSNASRKSERFSWEIVANEIYQKAYS
jgi:glycosyltransferase involved in cell wall biosynthesis